MKIVFAADLHGDMTRYAELAALVRAEAADVLLLGGDLFDYHSDLVAQLASVNGEVREWLATVTSPVYFVAGNGDWPASIHAFESTPATSPPRQLDLRPVALAPGIHAIGYPYIRLSPNPRTDASRRDLATERVALPDGSYVTGTDGAISPVGAGALNELPSTEESFAALEHVPAETILVSHSPPHGGQLDVGKNGEHDGTRAIAAAIARLQPLLSLHGHVHSSPAMTGHWAEWRGRTLSINPGYGDRLHAVVCDTDNLAETTRHTIYGRLP